MESTRAYFDLWQCNVMQFSSLRQPREQPLHDTSPLKPGCIANYRRREKHYYIMRYALSVTFPPCLTDLTRGNMSQLSSKFPEIKRDYEDEWPLEVLLRQAIIAKRRKIQREERQRRESMFHTSLMCAH